MIRSAPFFIGCRYILAKKGNRFISFTSLISMAGLVLGVFALIVVLSVFNGSQGIQRDRTLITVPHGSISTQEDFSQWQEVRDFLLQDEEIQAAAPYIELEAMLSQQGYHQVAQVKGIEPALETEVSDLDRHMTAGNLESLVEGSHNIVLARGLANTLRLNVGDAVNLVLPELREGSRAVGMKSHRFTVSGIFDVQFRIGSNLAYINLADSADILGLDNSTRALSLRLRLAHIHQARETLDNKLAALSAAFPEQDFSAIGWSESEASLFNALKLEKVMTSFMLMMIVAIGAFNIISTLVMVVSDKQADIAILRTMGAREKTIMAIFLVQGAMVGLVGTLVGAILGIVLVLNFELASGLMRLFNEPSDIYIISTLPAELQWPDVWIVCSCALIISFVATLYPAWKASRIHPAEILRYE